MVSTPQERKRLIQGVIVVGAGLAVPQVLAYAASVIAARLLVPAEFGAFGAMQGVTQIGTPIGLAIQAVVARRLVKNSQNKHHDLLKFGLEVSIAVMILTLLVARTLSITTINDAFIFMDEKICKSAWLYTKECYYK